jgi:FAD/FMN-containing dehydrogenase
MSSERGLALGLIVELEVVNAEGELLICNENENSDLFWAIKGAPSNFGIVFSNFFFLFVIF